MPTAGIGQSARSGEDGEAVQVRGLALVGRHAERRVALQVLDRLETLRAAPGARRRPSRRSASRRRPCPWPGISKSGSRPSRCAVRRRAAGRVRAPLSGASKPSALRGLRACTRAFLGRLIGVERAADGAGRNPVLRAARRAGTPRSPRHRPAARRPGWRDARAGSSRPRPRSASQVSSRAPHRQALARLQVENLHPDRASALAAAGGGDDMAGQALRPGLGELVSKRRPAPRARVDDRAHRHARRATARRRAASRHRCW